MSGPSSDNQKTSHWQRNAGQHEGPDRTGGQTPDGPSNHTNDGSRQHHASRPTSFIRSHHIHLRISTQTSQMPFEALSPIGAKATRIKRTDGKIRTFFGYDHSLDHQRRFVGLSSPKSRPAIRSTALEGAEFGSSNIKGSRWRTALRTTGSSGMPG